MTDAQRLVARLRTTGTIADHLLKSEAAAMIEQQAQRIGAWSELLWDIYKSVYGDKDARGLADPLAILPKSVLALRKRNDVLEADNAGSEAGIERLTRENAAAEAERDEYKTFANNRTSAMAVLVTRAETAKQRAQVARNMVNEQALDAGLWFVAKTAPEAYLQQALRRLHAAVEGGAAIAARKEA